MYRTRERRRGRNGPPIRRTGPTPSAKAGSRSEKQRLRRLLSAAAAASLEILEHFQRLHVLAVQRVEDATDVARMRFVSAELLEAGVSEEAVAAALVLDWACRSPELSAHFAVVARRRGRQLRTPLQVLGCYRELAMSKQWRTYWKGPTRLNLQKFVQSVDLAKVASFGEVFVSSSRLRAPRILRPIKSWKYIDTYLSFSLCRALAAALQKKLRDVEDDAAGMSANTTELVKIISFKAARVHLRSRLGCVPSDALLAFFYCETVKILRYEKLLQPMASYVQDVEGLATALTAPACKQFVVKLRGMSSEELSDNSETELLNHVLPAARSARHSSTDSVRKWRSVRDAVS